MESSLGVVGQGIAGFRLRSAEIEWNDGGNSRVQRRGDSSQTPVSGRTGQTETTMVAYDPAVTSTYDMLKEFWEKHDPTQGYRQGNDHGTQYRSAAYYTTDEQRELIERTRDAYAEVIAARGYPDITTEIGPADEQTYYLAEDYHQQYLYKNPNGYRCHANTGLTLPPL